MILGLKHIPSVIDGTETDPAVGDWIDVYEPATGQVYAKVASSNRGDVDRAVEAAQRAFPDWAGMSADDRGKVLERVADRIEARFDEFVKAESKDSGKPVSVARQVDIPRAMANLRFFAGAVRHWHSDAHDMGASALNYTLKRPRGVAGCISPWNLPLYLLTWKIAPALATGNTVVAKPSEVTPMTASLLAEAWREADAPRGVLSIVHGEGKTAGAAIVQHPGVSAVSFTGSTGVGEWIGAECGRALKPVSLELGGKNPFIVFADADIDSAIDTAERAAFSNQGQICLCGSRLLVERSAFETVVEGLVERARNRVIGDPMDPDTQHGAQVSADHLAKIAGYVNMARDLGANIRCGGNSPAISGRCAGGYFYEPTVITGLENDCAVIQEEIFGPVVTVQPFDSESEAVELANSTPYGLAASVFTSNLGRAHRVSAALESGIVWVNCWMLRDLRTPFGGMKQSGVGREGGAEALRFFTETKNVCIATEGAEGQRGKGAEGKA